MSFNLKAKVLATTLATVRATVRATDSSKTLAIFISVSTMTTTKHTTVAILFLTQFLFLFVNIKPKCVVVHSLFHVQIPKLQNVCYQSMHHIFYSNLKQNIWEVIYLISTRESRTASSYLHNFISPKNFGRKSLGCCLLKLWIWCHYLTCCDTFSTYHFLLCQVMVFLACMKAVTMVRWNENKKIVDN